MKSLLLRVLFLMIATTGLAADALASAPVQYSLSIARVYEATDAQPEWVFILGGVGSVRGGETVCKSPASLMKLLATLPPRSTLDWWPTCMGESSALNGHMEELKKTCSQAKVVFTVHPSG
ncbi:MAG TPA: hypothetical protein VMZ27_13470 [Candidatus Saccharimonadales bacterium]|nr:hypothetical protein [Candidatus Saccharimonadales bacterium]